MASNGLGSIIRPDAVCQLFYMRVCIGASEKF